MSEEQTTVITWGNEWDEQPMSEVEAIIKQEVNSKITGPSSAEILIPSVVNTDTYLVRLQYSDEKKIWTSTGIKKDDLFDSIGIKHDETDKTIALDGEVHLGTMIVADESTGESVTEPVVVITSDKITFAKPIDFAGKSIEVDKITRTPQSGNTDPLIISCDNGVQIGKLVATTINAPSSSGASLTINATTVNATGNMNAGTVEAGTIKGNAFYYFKTGENNTKTYAKIDLTDSSFTTTDLTAKNITATGGFKVEITEENTTKTYAASAGTYSAAPQYRPIEVVTDVPKTSTPGTLLAVLKPST